MKDDISMIIKSPVKINKGQNTKLTDDQKIYK